MTLEDSYFLSFYLQLLSYALPIWAGIKYFGYFDRSLKLFFLSVIIAFVIDVISWVLYKLGIQNHYLDYFFSFNSFFTKIIIYHLIIKNPKHRKLIIGIGVLIIPLFVFDVIWIAGTKHHNAFSGGVSQIWIFGATIYCLRQLINDTPVNIRLEAFFWIYIGILFKKGLTFFDMLFYDNVLNSSVTLTYILSDFTYLTSVVENILYTIGFRRAYK